MASKYGCDTEDEGALFPDHLAKAREADIRGRELTEKVGVGNYWSKRFEQNGLSTFVDHNAHRAYLDGVLVISHDGNNLTFVNKSMLNEILDRLRREQVLDDLGDIL